MTHRFGIPRMVLGFIAYALWCAIYPRRLKFFHVPYGM